MNLRRRLRGVGQKIKNNIYYGVGSVIIPALYGVYYKIVRWGENGVKKAAESVLKNNVYIKPNPFSKPIPYRPKSEIVHNVADRLVSGTFLETFEDILLHLGPGTALQILGLVFSYVGRGGNTEENESRLRKILDKTGKPLYGTGTLLNVAECGNRLYYYSKLEESLRSEKIILKPSDLKNLKDALYSRIEKKIPPYKAILKVIYEKTSSFLTKLYHLAGSLHWYVWVVLGVITLAGVGFKVMRGRGHTLA